MNNNDFWFNNPSILFTNLDQFIPINKLSINEKVNALARFAIYYTLVVWFLEKEQKWYYVSIALILFSYLTGNQHQNKNTENFMPKWKYGEGAEYYKINNNLYTGAGKNISNNSVHEQKQQLLLQQKQQLLQSPQQNQYLQNMKPYNNWDNNDITKSYCTDQNDFASWCYNSPTNQVNVDSKNDDNINIYYDKNKINNLPNNCLTLKVHLV